MGRGFRDWGFRLPFRKFWHKMHPENRKGPQVERCHAVAVRRLSQVVDSPDLEADNPLMDAGMDSLSGRTAILKVAEVVMFAKLMSTCAGVEFRNRLQTEFDGVNLPNSMVFDYPTITAAGNALCKLAVPRDCQLCFDGSQ